LAEGKAEGLASRISSSAPATANPTPAKATRARAAARKFCSAASVLVCGIAGTAFSAEAFPAASTRTTIPPNNSQPPLLSNMSRWRNLCRNC
jgi:hypothetical protein